MKNIVYAFIISILIHFLFFATFETKIGSKSPKKSQLTQKKQTIRYVKLKPKEIPKKIKTTPKKVKKSIAKKTATKKFKKVIKKDFKKPVKRKVVKKPKKIKSKPKSKMVVKPTVTQPLPKKLKTKIKPETVASKKKEKLTLEEILRKKIELEKKQNSLESASKKIQKQTLDSFLSTPDIGKDLVSSINQNYIDLYGDEFKDFTKIQKVFIKKNLNILGTITQNYMVYPRVSIRTNQHGTNVVEFMLYPNGDISTVLLSTSSGYEALDKSSIHTINIAYKDYPKPKEATKIKIYMTYVLY